MEIDAARLLVWRAAWMARNDQPLTAGEGSMAKLKAAEVADRATEKAVQVLAALSRPRCAHRPWVRQTFSR